ncbi:MAG: CvpA family protein [Pseudomonadota bacterium]
MLITLLDVILIAIMLVSGFLALMRGFTREVLSIASWGAAAVAALFAFNSGLRPLIESEFSQKIVADAVLVVGVFLVTLFVVSLVTARISDAILDSRIGALDRSAGFLFGLLRGLVIVVIGFLFFNWLVPEQGQPKWVRDARARPILQSTGDWILAQLPSDPEAAIQQLKNRKDDQEQQPQEAPGAAPAPAGKPPNYSTDEIETETPAEEPTEE